MYFRFTGRHLHFRLPVTSGNIHNGTTVFLISENREVGVEIAFLCVTDPEIRVDLCL